MISLVIVIGLCSALVLALGYRSVSYITGDGDSLLVFSFELAYAIFSLILMVGAYNRPMDKATDVLIVVWVLLSFGFTAYLALRFWTGAHSQPRTG